MSLSHYRHSQRRRIEASPILDRAPKGRDEDNGFQLWIRRHDEYDSQ